MVINANLQMLIYQTAFWQARFKNVLLNVTRQMDVNTLFLETNLEKEIQRRRSVNGKKQRTLHVPKVGRMVPMTFMN